MPKFDKNTAVVCNDCDDSQACAKHKQGDVDVPVRCGRCIGTGKFITMIENGLPKGPGGPCFRCNGKGYHLDADRRRNWGYDRYGVKVF